MKRLSRRIPRRQLPLRAFWPPQPKTREIGRSASDNRDDSEPRTDRTKRTDRTRGNDVVPPAFDQLLREALRQPPSPLLRESERPRLGVLVLLDGSEILGFWTIGSHGHFEGMRSSTGSATPLGSPGLEVWSEVVPSHLVARLALVRPVDDGKGEG